MCARLEHYIALFTNFRKFSIAYLSKGTEPPKSWTDSVSGAASPDPRKTESLVVESFILLTSLSIVMRDFRLAILGTSQFETIWLVNMHMLS